MGYTTAKLDALEDAIASGELTVKYQDRVVTYRSLEEMRSIRQEMRQALGLSPRSVRKYAKPSKGLLPGSNSTT